MTNIISKNILKNIIISAAAQRKLSEDKFGKIKREFLKNKRIRSIPQNTELIPIYRKLVKSGKISANQTLENILRKKKMRSLSGIASVTVITPDFGCPGKCIYCPTEKGMPKSYLSNEPAVMRAITNKFDPYLQVASRIKMLKAQGHPTDKIELIIAGGTWSYIPEWFQIWFVANCYAAANEGNYIKKLKAKNQKLKTQLKIKNLLDKKLFIEQKKNEIIKNRIVGLTLETRPDWINEKEIRMMRLLGCTRVELGVQSIYEDVLKKCGRGHSVKETIEATKILKDAGFKINYHIMLGLPGSTPKRDEKMLEELFTNPDFQPDMLKIYPCVVLKSASLYKLYKSGKYKPYSDKQIIKILKKAKTKIPEYCRIVRIVRDIPTPSIIAGGKISNLREMIQREMLTEGKQCRCVRCREIKNLKIKTKNLKLKRFDYNASGGREIFLSFEDIKNDKLVAMLRLRIVWPLSDFFSVLRNSAIIREAHTYGQMEKIDEKGGPPSLKLRRASKTQHLGLGKKLIKEAERIVKKEFCLKKIAVISGIGARNYYRKLGYKLDNTYMVKNLKVKMKK